MSGNSTLARASWPPAGRKTLWLAEDALWSVRNMLQNDLDNCVGCLLLCINMDLKALIGKVRNVVLGFPPGPLG